jgi:type VI secretion system protein ImpA
MTTGWNGGQLLEPVTPDAPCGKNFDDTDALSAFDAYQIFGQTTLEPTPPEPGEPVRKEPRKSDRPPDWDEIKDLALERLQESKDLRLLAHLSAALLRTNGFPAFAETMRVASSWLQTYWAQVYPLLEEDGIFRRNALNCLADPVAVVDGIRRAPLIESRQHGRVTLRDVDIASGVLTPGASEPRPDDSQITAAFASAPIDELQRLESDATSALEAALAMDAVMRREVGVEAAPSFDPLVGQLKRLQTVLRSRIAVHPSAAAGAASSGAVAGEGAVDGGVVSVGAIRSRQDAIRALDAAAEFFRRNEPSSPVPMFVERAKRLVAKDFLEVLADIAPEALPQVRAAGGIREES